MDHQSERGVGEYVAILRRRKWIVIVSLLVAPAVAVAVARSQPKLYRASADVLLTSAATGVSSPLSADPNSSMQTQVEVAGAPIVAQRVVRASRVTTRTADQVRSEASFIPVGGSSVLRMQITDRNRALAAIFANAYAEQYVQYRRQLDTSFINSTREEIQARMKALQDAGQRGSPVYTALAQKEQDLLQVAALQTVSAVVLRQATGAVRIQPRPTRDGLIGAAVGLLLGLAVALLWEAVDPRVRTTQDLSDLLGLPVLGRLAAPPRKLRKGRRLVMLEDASGAEADGLRILRTNLDFANVDRRIKTIVVTSASKGEGKSTTVANLAVALARAGRRVALVDLDLHRPVVEKFFSLEGRPGLTDVALGHVTLDEALVRVPIIDPDKMVAGVNGRTNGANGYHHVITVLNVLPTGPLPPSPGEFVASDTVRTIVERAAEQSDLVLIDAPPLLEMSDTLALSAAVDAVVLVARLKSARRPLLRQARRILETAPVSTVGVVVTGAEQEKAYWYERYASYYYTAQHPQHTAPSSTR